MLASQTSMQGQPDDIGYWCSWSHREAAPQSLKCFRDIRNVRSCNSTEANCADPWPLLDQTSTVLKHRKVQVLPLNTPKSDLFTVSWGLFDRASLRKKSFAAQRHLVLLSKCEWHVGRYRFETITRWGSSNCLWAREQTRLHETTEKSYGVQAAWDD